jgi:hypothetical protein
MGVHVHKNGLYKAPSTNIGVQAGICVVMQVSMIILDTSGKGSKRLACKHVKIQLPPFFFARGKLYRDQKWW